MICFECQSVDRQNGFHKVLRYQCLHCGLDKPIYRQRFCKSCFYEAPKRLIGSCIPNWANRIWKPGRTGLGVWKVQLQPHIVFGQQQQCKGWRYAQKSDPYPLDRSGSPWGHRIVELPNRYLAGITEVALKNTSATKPIGDDAQKTKLRMKIWWSGAKTNDSFLRRCKTTFLKTI